MFSNQTCTDAIKRNADIDHSLSTGTPHQCLYIIQQQVSEHSKQQAQAKSRDLTQEFAEKTVVSSLSVSMNSASLY